MPTHVSRPRRRGRDCGRQTALCEMSRCGVVARGRAGSTAADTEGWIESGDTRVPLGTRRGVHTRAASRCTYAADDPPPLCRVLQTPPARPRGQGNCPTSVASLQVFAAALSRMVPLRLREHRTHQDAQHLGNTSISRRVQW